MAPPPQSFYRVQHRGSYTTYNQYNGFESRGHYDADPADLLKKWTVEAHLDWGDRSNQPSPFISVFDNYGIASLRNMPTLTLIYHPDDAYERAYNHVQRGNRGVFIAEIGPTNLYPFLTTVDIENRLVNLRIWQTPNNDTFVRILDLRSALRLKPWMCQASEWLVIDQIPVALIRLL